MIASDTTIWMHPAAGGCSFCAASAEGPACTAAADDGGCGTPALTGEPALLARVLQALRSVTARPDGPNLVDAHRVRGLHIGDGEAELALVLGSGCPSQLEVADAAFQVLRRVLPETDVYVSHAA